MRRIFIPIATVTDHVEALSAHMTVVAVRMEAVTVCTRMHSPHCGGDYKHRGHVAYIAAATSYVQAKTAHAEDAASRIEDV